MRFDEIPQFPRAGWEVLRFYLDLNVGGTPHSQEEIERVRRLLRKEEDP